MHSRGRRRSLGRLFVLVIAIGAVMVALPAVALAAAPMALTGQATETGATSEQIDGAVFPEGESTTYLAQYDTSSSTWCSTNGSTGSPASSSGSQTLGYSDNGWHQVSVSLTGLTSGQSYCARLVAQNASGTSDGNIITFTAGLPQVSTDDTERTGASTATVNGSVNPGGQSTTYEVQYDLASSDWCTSFGASGSPGSSTTPQTLAYTDANYHGVSVSLTGLPGAQGYCARLVATNPSGTSYGEPVSGPSGAPTAYAYGALPTGASTATVQGEVNPVGQTTTYQVQYDLGSSELVHE